MQISDIQLVLLPPVGADARIFYPQQVLPCTTIAIDPIEWRAGESIKGHAARLYDLLRKDARVDFTLPIVWGGLSLGGAIAQELSLLHKPLGVMMMGSFTSSREINPIVRIVCASSSLVPLKTFDLAAIATPYVMRALSYLSRKDISLMNEMFREYDKRSFRNALISIRKWPGTKQPLNARRLRIHGRKDPIIPLFMTSDVDHAIDSQHLLSLAEPAKVNQLIEQFLRGLLTGSNRSD